MILDKKKIKWHKLRFKISVKLALITISIPFFLIISLIINENIAEFYLEDIKNDWEKLKNIK